MKQTTMTILAVCAMALMFGCKNQGKTEAATKSDTLSAVIDSIIEENDTTPMPMFLLSGADNYLQMYYWSFIEEPQKTDDNANWFDEMHQNWALQEMFRRNASQYTNLLAGDKIIKVKYVDEVLKDPDGNTPSIGELHRDEIPALGARFLFANPKDHDGERNWGTVVVTDSYLKSRKQLPIKFFEYEWGKEDSLPKAIVSQLEQKYGMKAERSELQCTFGGHYQWGTLQFKGEYKNAPKNEYDKDRKSALALDVLIDGDKIYTYEEIGYYNEEYGPTWNADDDGRYVGSNIMAAFEGPKGLELCYSRFAPESSAYGMFYLRGGQLVLHNYETYHNMIDEQIPVWKRDIAEMQRIYNNDERCDRGVTFTKWAHCYIDYSNEWIWLRDGEEKNGAFFIRHDDGKFTLVAVETPRLKPSRFQKGGVNYLKLSGSAGGPSWQEEIYAFKDGKQIEEFRSLKVYGEIDGCTLNGKEVSKEEGQAYLDKLPEAEKLEGWFTDTEKKE